MMHQGSGRSVLREGISAATLDIDALIDTVDAESKKRFGVGARSKVPQLLDALWPELLRLPIRLLLQRRC